jgi:predicted O-methyltransferase YrrM
VDPLRTAWRLLPGSVRSRVRAYLADHNIGPLPLPRPSALPGHLGAVIDAPTEMSIDERIFLYALVRGFAPRRVLEIGTSQGGSASIIAAALEDNGQGEVAGIDPYPRIEVAPAGFYGRFHLVTGTSPEVIPQAVEALGGSVDLLLIDGIHVYKQARTDLIETLPCLCPSAYILFHDAFHFGVSEAIRETVEQYPQLHDCGYVCSRPRRVGDLLTHAGFRLIRMGPAIVDIAPLVEGVWAEAGKQPPHDLDLRNHDIWYCTAIEPCAYCQREAATSSHGGDGNSP